jgi:hypothetical protein
MTFVDTDHMSYDVRVIMFVGGAMEACRARSRMEMQACGIWSIRYIRSTIYRTCTYGKYVATGISQSQSLSQSQVTVNPKITVKRSNRF